MQLGESSKARPIPIEPEDSTLGSQHHDDGSGLVFQKRRRVTHVERTEVHSMQYGNDMYDLTIPRYLSTPSPEKEDTASIVSAATMSSTTHVLERPLPSKHIPTTEYIQHIPKQLGPNSRLRQLLIWFAKKELERDVSLHRKNNPITERVKRELIQQLHTSKKIVSYKRQMDIPTIHIKPNPINEENKKLCIHYEKEIKNLEAEAEEWEKCTNQIYEQHAISLDVVGRLETSEFRVGEDINSISNVDPDQQEFIKKLLDKNSGQQIISDFVSNMDPEMTQLRTTLEISNAFYLKTKELTNHVLPKLAHLVHESQRLAPVDSDENELGLFEDTEEKRKADEIKNTEFVFRLLQSQGKK